MKNQWFIMAYTIVIVFLAMLVFTGIYTLFSADLQIAKYQKGILSDYFSFSNNNSTMRKSYDSMNSDGKKEDNLSCSWGIISCYEGKWATCSSDNWVATPDGIPDSCDNDDGTPRFYTGNIANILSTDSKKSDNDAYINQNSIGFLLPGETRTVFSFNEEIKNYFILNNVDYRITLNKAYSAIMLHGEFSLTWGTSNLYTLQKWDISNTIVSEKNWIIQTNTGSFDDNGNVNNTAIPYLWNAEMYDIVLNITNTSSDILRYRIYADNTGDPLYFIPINKTSRSPLPQYKIKNGELSKQIFPSE